MLFSPSPLSSVGQAFFNYVNLISNQKLMNTEWTLHHKKLNKKLKSNSKSLKLQIYMHLSLHLVTLNKK